MVVHFICSDNTWTNPKGETLLHGRLATLGKRTEMLTDKTSLISCQGTSSLALDVEDAFANVSFCLFGKVKKVLTVSLGHFAPK